MKNRGVIKRTCTINEHENGVIRVFYSYDIDDAENVKSSKIYEGRTFTDALEKIRVKFFGEE